MYFMVVMAFMLAVPTERISSAGYGKGVAVGTGVGKGGLVGTGSGVGLAGAQAATRVIPRRTIKVSSFFRKGIVVIGSGSSYTSDLN
jgi:hypothetical protein